MKGAFLNAAVGAMILTLSPIPAAHAAARVQEPDTHATADLNRQSFQAAQTGKTVEATDRKQTKSAEPKSAKAKVLRRNYAIRAKIARQKAKQQSLKAKKQLAKSKKQSLKAKKKQAA